MHVESLVAYLPRVQRIIVITIICIVKIKKMIRINESYRPYREKKMFYLMVGRIRHRIGDTTPISRILVSPLSLSRYLTHWVHVRLIDCRVQYRLHTRRLLITRTSRFFYRDIFLPPYVKRENTRGTFAGTRVTDRAEGRNSLSILMARAPGGGLAPRAPKRNMW